MNNFHCDCCGLAIENNEERLILEPFLLYGKTASDQSNSIVNGKTIDICRQCKDGGAIRLNFGKFFS